MNNEKCLLLIELYKKNRLLWDITNSRYSSKLARDSTWQKISTQIDIPVVELKKKMTVLMGSYRREKSRQKRNLRSGLYTKSKWFAFDAFSFLTDKYDVSRTSDTYYEPPSKNSPNAETTTSEISSEVIFKNEPVDFEETSTQICTEPTIDDNSDDIEISQQQFIQPTTQNKRARTEITESDHSTLSEAFYDYILKNRASPSDSYLTFGHYVANELRKYDPHTLACVKHAINNIIFEADMGRYETHKQDSSTTENNQ